jgi:hypothetical protein
MDPAENTTEITDTTEPTTQPTEQIGDAPAAETTQEPVTAVD